MLDEVSRQGAPHSLVEETRAAIDSILATAPLDDVPVHLIPEGHLEVEITPFEELADVVEQQIDEAADLLAHSFRLQAEAERLTRGILRACETLEALAETRIDLDHLEEILEYAYEQLQHAGPVEVDHV